MTACSRRFTPLLLRHKVLFLRNQDLDQPVAQAITWPSPSASASSRTTRWPQPSGAPGLVQIYKNPDSPMDRYENCLAHRRHLARDAAHGLRAALRGVPTRGRRHDVGQHGAGLREAAGAHQGARSPACAPATASMHPSPRPCRIEKRLALKAQYPDAEHPVVRTHPETGEKVLFVNAFTTHFVNLPHPGARALRPGLQQGRRRPAAVPDQPGLYPRVPGALALEAQQHGDLGQPLAPSTTP
jgi:taurine dioxygenase